MRALAVALALLAACTSDDDLAVDQGVCTGLSATSCMIEPACQEAYVAGGLAPILPLSCLLVESSPKSTVACETLDHDHCRARNDCTPMFFQKTGPTDAAVGEPTYQDCATEMFPTASR